MTDDVDTKETRKEDTENAAIAERKTQILNETPVEVQGNKQEETPEVTVVHTVPPKITVEVKAETAEPGGTELNESDLHRLEKLRALMDSYYDTVPSALRDLPSAQERCLQLLFQAENSLTDPVSRCNVVEARLALTRVEIEIGRSRSAKSSFLIVVSIVYIFALAVGLGVFYHVISVTTDVKAMNSQMIMGVPVPILIWSFIGSLTSMLMRAGNFPFSNRTEALRWLWFRPIVGIVMGILTYLMVVAGLIVFSGSAKPQTPELLWVIAFVGSFSDTLSINLLQSLLGKFEGVQPNKNGSKSDTERPAGGGPMPHEATAIGETKLKREIKAGNQGGT